MIIMLHSCTTVTLVSFSHLNLPKIYLTIYDILNTHFSTASLAIFGWLVKYFVFNCGGMMVLVLLLRKVWGLILSFLNYSTMNSLYRLLIIFSFNCLDYLLDNVKFDWICRVTNISLIFKIKAGLTCIII